MENSELITKALEYIRDHNGDNALTIEDIAKHAGFSTDYFNRIFFAHTGFNVMEYLRFCRLKKAAQRLRYTDDNVLDIALHNGYETHESFSRAFKKQYGASPTEYRKKYCKKQPLYGEYHNDTVCNRMTHEFKDLKPADRDEVIDWLLEKDAMKYGYVAVSLIVNGGPVLYSGDDFRGGCVWVTEWTHGFDCDIICDDYAKAAEYLKLFKDDRFNVNLHTLDDDQKIIKGFDEQGVEISSISRRYETVYCGEPFRPEAPEGVNMRELKYSDADLLDRFNAARTEKLPMIGGIKKILHFRDVLGGEDCSEFCFGMFRNKEMIGLSIGSLQHAHGFTLNNCIYTYFIDGCASEELYVYAYKYVTDAALEKGALPFDDVQTPDTPENQRDGSFNSTDFGYKLSMCVCVLKYRVK
ncbi:MAG: helix-turn-helix transcriptional regulator [Clostridia bacterium]|nr:helix-turn-helix transcriptional regulator [Clostridia bacterium]